MATRMVTATRTRHPPAPPSSRHARIRARHRSRPSARAPVYAEHASAIEDDALYAPLRGETAVLTRHTHVHRHGRGPAHLHWHDHPPATVHPVLAGFATEPPLHRHRHKTTARTGAAADPRLVADGRRHPRVFCRGEIRRRLIRRWPLVFALSTIATYVALCVYSSAGLQRLRLGAVERYGEVLSGAVIALVGVLFGLWPAFQ